MRTDAVSKKYCVCPRFVIKMERNDDAWRLMFEKNKYYLHFFHETILSFTSSSVSVYTILWI